MHWFEYHSRIILYVFFFFQAEDGIRDVAVTGVQTCALPILRIDLDQVLAGWNVEHAIFAQIVAVRSARLAQLAAVGGVLPFHGRYGEVADQIGRASCRERV